jgi:hypothetical protein
MKTRNDLYAPHYHMPMMRGGCCCCALPMLAGLGILGLASFLALNNLKRSRRPILPRGDPANSLR